MPRLLQLRSVFRLLSCSSILSICNMNTIKTVLVASEKHMHVYIMTLACKFWLLVIQISWITFFNFFDTYLLFTYMGFEKSPPPPPLPFGFIVWFDYSIFCWIKFNNFALLSMLFSSFFIFFQSELFFSLTSENSAYSYTSMDWQCLQWSLHLLPACEGVRSSSRIHCSAYFCLRA